ncbi:YopX family protein [Lactiplantibacillus plantarum]
MGPDGEYDEGDLDVFKFEQFTGLTDVNGKDIYEGDVLQPVISYTKRNIGKPFEVKKGNYVYGKWIAKDVSSKEFGVDGYYFSNEMRLIGNVHTNPELLEEHE